MSTYHTPVLLNEVLDGLNIISDGIYVDCTFGGGGHSMEMLKHLGRGGRLIVFDQDEDARQNIPNDDRILFVPHNFRHLKRFLKLNDIGLVDGILADLGVSSHQLDKAERGFSIRYEGALDMRMDNRQNVTAYDIVNRYPEERLHKIFEQYGEVTNAKTLARTIVDVRKSNSLNTITNFKKAISGAVKGNPNKYFAQVFQALRIEVNDEMNALKELLIQMPSVMKPGARAVMITFHSLEDRIVKTFFKMGSFDEDAGNPFEMTNKPQAALKVITRKPVVPGEDEYKLNPRSRSAKLRVAEKV